MGIILILKESKKDNKIIDAEKEQEINKLLLASCKAYEESRKQLCLSNQLLCAVIKLINE